VRAKGLGKGIALAALAAALTVWSAPDPRRAAGPAPARADEHAESAGGHEHHEHKEVPGSAPLPDRSVYQLGGTWTDQRGRPFRLDQLRGHPVAALLFYGTCKQACPILVHDVQRLDEMLDPAARERTRYLLVTFDPARDTPERLAAYARDHKLDPARWTLLRGGPEQVRELAMVLGVKYRPTGGGEFNHTMRITLLDRDGVAALHVDGLRQPLDSLVKTLSRL